MKINWKIPKGEALFKLLGQYKYVLIVIAAGILLLLWPSGEKKSPAAAQSGLTGGEEDFSVEALEERLARVLSKIDGAGEVSVVLTVESGMERVLATDIAASQWEDRRDREEQTVIISTDEGEEAVLLTQRYPTFQGALVVCPGGNDPEVRLRLTQAISVLTGLGSDRITVCKGA